LLVTLKQQEQNKTAIVTDVLVEYGRLVPSVLNSRVIRAPPSLIGINPSSITTRLLLMNGFGSGRIDPRTGIVVDDGVLVVSQSTNTIVMQTTLKMPTDDITTVVCDVHYFDDGGGPIATTRYFVLLDDETSVGSTMSLNVEDAR
jgi:hypothetical protein